MAASGGAGWRLRVIELVVNWFLFHLQQGKLKSIAIIDKCHDIPEDDDGGAGYS